MYTCAICMSSSKKNLIEPVYCDCKIKFHEECLIRCYKEGLLCPICRIKDDILESSDEESSDEESSDEESSSAEDSEESSSEQQSFNFEASGPL